MSKVRKWMMEERCCSNGVVPDPAIKLFGKTIPVPNAKAADNSSSSANNQEGVDESRTQSEEELEELGRSSSAGSNGCGEEHKRPKESSSENVPKQSPVATEEGSNDKKQKSEQQLKQEEQHEKEEEMETDKVPKKPEKPVPCPRCDSMDTKFCYYNNYNINQPRHFCKNCQRYWTSGGSLRNVPVGAGRRKNKHAAAAAAAVNSTHQLHHQQHQQPQWADAAGLNYHALKLVAPRILQAAAPPVPPADDASIITSLGGQHSSAASSFQFGGLIHRQQQHGQSPNNGMSSSNSEVTSMWQQQQQQCHRLQECDSVCASPAKNSSRREQLSSTSTSTSSKSNAAPAADHSKCPHEASAADWVFPMGFLGKNNNGSYSSLQQAWSNNNKLEPAAAAASEDHESNMAAAAAAAWAGGGMPCWPPPPLPPLPPALAAAAGQWSMQWAAVAAVAAAANANNAAAAQQPLLGKRNTASGEGGLWVPKTLRIDDPGDAARSSIWAALGVERKQHTDAAAAAGIGIGMLQSSIPSNEQQQQRAKLMQCIQLQEGLRANPAAMARSATFQESN